MTEPNLDAVAADADALVGLHRRVSTLDPRAYLRPEHAATLETAIAAPLREVVEQAAEVLQRIEQACDHGEADAGDWGEHLEDTGFHESARVAGALADELWQHVSNLCFTARSELRRAARLLRGAPGDHDERVAACESARRKLRRGLVAVLDAVGRAQGKSYAAAGELEAEVETAAAVRRMYGKFRRSLPACDPGDPSQVRRALRYAAVSLAVMVGNGDFAEIRADDRTMILGLQRRILAWARDGAAEADGARLYQDLVTAADLLRSINLRQELAAHDRAVIDETLRAIAGAPSDEQAVAAILPHLRALTGRDDELDAAIEAALRGAPASEVLARVRGAIEAAAGGLNVEAA